MESNLIVAALALALGLALGWRLSRRAAALPLTELPDEERMVWLQRLSTVGQMLSGVVHEVRTPLNTITLTVEHAQRMLDRGQDARALLQTVADEADRAVDILSDILDFAKPSALNLKPVNLSAVITSALDPLNILFEQHGVAVAVHVAEDARVMASPRHLHQVLTNLMINALNAMPFAGCLIIRADVEKSMTRLSLTDNGIGIERADLERLFQPFATGRAEDGGTGLGLHVARWIMNKHGGDVAITSAGIGKGTTVVVSLQNAPPD